jgi:hypothetical protein
MRRKSLRSLHPTSSDESPHRVKPNLVPLGIDEVREESEVITDLGLGHGTCATGALDSGKHRCQVVAAVQIDNSALL